MKPALLLLAALPLCTAAEPIDLAIAPGKIDEICAPMAAGDTLRWRFEADAALDFNVHHHVGKQVLMPVQAKRTKRHDGTHAIDQANDWCLMFTAPKERAVRVRGEWSLTKRP
jgi:hypothetical protein